MNDIAAFLATSPIFAGFDESELEAVAATLVPKAYSGGATVFRQGDPGSELYFVKSGRVGSFVSMEDGGRRQIYEFFPGRFFGEMAIVGNTPRSATCSAEGDTELLALRARDFFALVKQRPALGVKLLRSMARVMASWIDEASGFLDEMVRWGENARRRAVADELTGLFNRRFLEESVRLRFARSAQAAGSSPCSLLMLDVDRFHAYNDAYGMKSGDSIIASLGDVFGKITAEGDTAARLAGDEFAFFLPSAGIDEAASFAERIRAAAAGSDLEFVSEKTAETVNLRLTVSIGVAAFPKHADAPDKLFASSDRALFRAKENGRNRVALAPE
ncbi:MAG: GGDEF domain-containing protein [Spirochaetes bacterium]|nr:GGDEF domain-containing protein [Spirochaetota bacterium]